MKVAFPLIIMAAALVMLVGCSDSDCPACPAAISVNPPYDGRLYASTMLGEKAIFVIDTQTDSVIDSILPGLNFWSFGIASDGSLLAASDMSGTYIIDAATLQTTAVVASLYRPSLVGGNRYLLGCTSKSYSLYDLTDCSLVWSRDMNMWGPHRYDDRTNAFYGLSGADTLFRLQIDSSKITNQWVIRTQDGQEARVYDFDISADSRRFYGLVANSRYGDFLILSLETDSVISDFRLYGPLGAARVSPNGKEVWVTDPANGGLEPVYPGTVYIFDALTGEYLRGISLYGYVPWPQVGLDAWELEFTPDGSHAYVLTGSDLDPPTGNILRIDTRSYRVENLIFPEFDHYLATLAIGPKP